MSTTDTAGDSPREPVTQMDFARAGQITPQMRAVAEYEGRDPEYIRERVARGSIAIPANIRHIERGLTPRGVGEGLSTKVNVNLGISGDKADAVEEWKKVDIAIERGADAIMDLSNSGKTRAFRQQVIDECPLMVGTVPMYDAIGYMEKPLVELTAEDLLEVLRVHAEDGVDFVTVHAGINRSVMKTFGETGRLMNIVSRGGSLLFGWMEVTGNENPFYEFYDEVLNICHEYDDYLLGDSCPARVALRRQRRHGDRRDDRAGQAHQARLGRRRAGHGRGPRSHGDRRDRGEHQAAKAAVPQRPLLRAGAARDRHRRGYDHHRGHRRRHLGLCGRGLPVLRDPAEHLLA